jgi:hypothetical protein
MAENASKKKIVGESLPTTDNNAQPVKQEAVATN